MSYLLYIASDSFPEIIYTEDEVVFIYESHNIDMMVSLFEQGGFPDSVIATDLYAMHTFLDALLKKSLMTDWNSDTYIEFFDITNFSISSIDHIKTHIEWVEDHLNIKLKIKGVNYE